MLSDTQLQEFGEWERAEWEQRAQHYAASIGDLTKGSISALLDAASVRSGTRLLDVGSGPGFVALAAMKRGAVVRAADQSLAMVEIARSAGVDSVASNVETLPFVGGEFDAVVAGYLLNHLPRPEVAVAELSRVLAPGGRLAMTVWDVPTVNASTGLLGEVVTSLGLSGVVPPGPDSLRFSDENELKTLFAAWDDVVVQRPRWTITVSPRSWFDAVAGGAPRTGAVLAQAGPEVRARAREKYVEVAIARYGIASGLVELPAAAVLVSAAKPTTH